MIIEGIDQHSLLHRDYWVIGLLVIVVLWLRDTRTTRRNPFALRNSILNQGFYAEL